MQNEQVNNAVPWNPWHGCKKVSPGCKNCFVFNMDKRYGRDTNIIEKGKTTYKLKEKDCPPGTLVKLCFSSDFFLEEADEWREGCWDAIRSHPDCTFVLTTKRPERILQSLPADWGDGWDNVHMSISIENQEMADRRLPYFLDVPMAHHEVFCSPLIGPMTLGKHLDTGLIQCVNVGGEMAPKNLVRPLQWGMGARFVPGGEGTRHRILLPPERQRPHARRHQHRRLEPEEADRARQAIGHLRTGGSYLTLKSLQPSHANRMEDTPANAPKIK